MKILICDDDKTSLTKVDFLLKKFGYDTLPLSSSSEALKILTSPDAPKMAVLDWMMPHYSGIDICKAVRDSASLISTYVLMLTSKNSSEDLAEAFSAGANDFITKPCDAVELQARIANGVKLVQLERELKTLTGLLPICSWCKKIRKDGEDWMQIEAYVEKHSYAQFTHGGCPDCLAKARKELRGQVT